MAILSNSEMKPRSKPILKLKQLKKEASKFSEIESACNNPTLFGVTDGKAVGTYLEHKFKEHLMEEFTIDAGNSANGIDLPALEVDIKVTSIKQPQSSCPYKSARQKIYGLGYSLLLFVYDKKDDAKAKTAQLNMLHTIFIDRKRTGDYQMTRILRELVSKGANQEEIISCLTDRNLPIDEIEAKRLASEVLRAKPNQGYLTISNALQWRLQYSRIVENRAKVDGLERL